MQGGTYWQGLWRLADPKVSLASFAGLFLAACFAARDVGLHVGWLIATIVGVFFVEVAKNASGEVVDYDSGTDLAVTEEDRSPFSGGKRVLVDGLLSQQQTRRIAAAFYTAAILVGLCIAVFRDLRILAFGIVGMALAWFYHGGAPRLSYRGLGELAVLLAYGPVIVCGTYFVQAGAMSAPLLQFSLVLGLLVACFLWINQFPDYRADLASGKRNLVVRLGRPKAARVYVLAVLIAYLWLGVAALYMPASSGALWGLVGFPLAAFSALRLLRSPEITQAIIPAQAASLGSFVLMALGSGAGYLLSAPHP